MAETTLKGSCLCKAVQYEIRPPFIRFSHCYCSRCRKATGTGRGTNIAVAFDQFKWISGEDFDPPLRSAGGAEFLDRRLHALQLPRAEADARARAHDRSLRQPRRSAVDGPLGASPVGEPCELGGDRRVAPAGVGVTKKKGSARLLFDANKISIQLASSDGSLPPSFQ
jgi:Glutathione-dependent formaldehyde-activating enzyme